MGLNSYLLTIRMYGGAGAAATWGFEFRTSFSRGNVSFVLAVTFRARLFLFPVPCSLISPINQNIPLPLPLPISPHLWYNRPRNTTSNQKGLD